jgi:hypothetical protein
MNAAQNMWIPIYLCCRQGSRYIQPNQFDLTLLETFCTRTENSDLLSSVRVPDEFTPWGPTQLIDMDRTCVMLPREPYVRHVWEIHISGADDDLMLTPSQLEL